MEEETVQIEEQEQANELTWKHFFEKLPPEMLTKIHEWLDLKSLLRCCAVSRQWNEIASSVSRSRADLELEFFCCEFKSNPESKIEIYSRNKNRTLKEFIELFSASQNFPWARYSFHRFGSWTFSNPHWINFLSAFSENIKCLKFTSVQFWENEIDLVVIENLSNLLFNLSQLPNLQELGLDLQHEFENSATISLISFPFSSTENSEKTENENPDPASAALSSKQCKEEKPSKKVKFPRLKILYLDEFMFSKFTRIVTDLLDVSVNLRKIEPFQKNECYKSIESFHFLQSLGKLDCVKMTEIKLNREFLSKIRENPAAPLTFKLKRLNLSTCNGYKSTRDVTNSTIFLSNLFQSAKTSLEELTVDLMGVLRDLQLAKFSKLAKLHILFVGYPLPTDFFLPAGTKFADIFRVLQTLDLENPWRTIFPQDGADSDLDFDSCSVSAIPSLKTLIITGNEMDGETIAQISGRFPNLKNLNIKKGEYDFPEVGSVIWTRMKNLESLELIVDVLAPANVFPSVDSCITGISREECLHLYNLYQVKQKECDADFAHSKLNLNLNRINPSILDLKDLRYFEIRLASYHSAIDDDRRPESMDNVMNRICEDYAFQLMENLTYNIFGRR